MEHFPEKLGHDTIIEALFELRFTSANESVADILPGLLYPNIRSEFPTIERLAITQLPIPVLQADDNLRYMPHYKLSGDHYYLQLGKHVFSIGCPRPYSGWSQFSEKIHALMDLLRQTNILDSIERFSIKYTNLIPESGDFSLAPLEVNLKAGAFDLETLPTHIRTEVMQDGFLNIIQISSRVTATTQTNQTLEGVLLDIDTISWQHDLSNFWDVYADLLEHAHLVEKRIFFSMLTKETIERLEPHWGGNL